MDEADVQQRARQFVANVGAIDVRGDLGPYLEAANAKLRLDELAPGESGYTVTRPDGRHVITVNKLEPDERQRFTICHEIAHVVLDLPSSHRDVPSWAPAKRDLNEVMCDVFAAELLMPYQQWKAATPADEPSAEVVQLMADAFGVSYPAAASRYATLSDLPCAHVTMERGVVRHAARSMPLRRIGAWIAPSSPVPAGSVAYRLREKGESGTETDSVPQDVWFDGLGDELVLTEICRHYAQFDTTLSLIWFEPEDFRETEVNRFGRREVEAPLLDELTGRLQWPGRRRRR